MLRNNKRGAKTSAAGIPSNAKTGFSNTASFVAARHHGAHGTLYKGSPCFLDSRWMSSDDETQGC